MKGDREKNILMSLAFLKETMKPITMIGRINYGRELS
jgi:hypothetical protein